MITMVGGIMGNQQAIEAIKPVVFGRRKVRPRACLADGKQHIRTFLADALEELGFITCECAHVAALPAILDTQPPDLVVLGLSAGGIEGAAMLTILAAHAYDGKVLLLGPRDWPMVAAVRERGEELGLAMLPLLTTAGRPSCPPRRRRPRRSTWRRRSARAGSSCGTSRSSTRAR